MAGLTALPAVLWLALSETPTTRRIRRINEKIRSGQLGSLDGVPAQRLALQVPWLAKYAGVTSAVGVNVPIELGRVNVIVTTPEHRELTGCGLGNAIYDPTLQTIFLDKSLVWPLETLIEGDSGTMSMFKLDEYTFVTSFVNFILAHELGHWRRSRKPAACFRYGLLDDEGDDSRARALDWTEEQAADRISVQTIVDAYKAKDTPEQIYGLNSAILMGLDTDRLDPAQLAAADIIASMLEMTKVMLFTGGPYSPFFSDSQHPNFLQRCADAIREVLGGVGDESFLERLPVVREELRRIEAISRNDYLELIFPEPIARADIRADSLWVGVVPVEPTPTSPLEKLKFPTEALFHVPKDLLKKYARASRISVKASEAIATGDSAPKPGGDPYSTPGLWIGALFSNGDPSRGLPAPQISRPRPDKGRDDYSPFPGFVYTGRRWSWPGRDGGSVEVDEEDVQTASSSLGYGTLKFGPFQRMEDHIAIPAVRSAGDGRDEFVVLVLRQSTPVLVDADARYTFVCSAGRLDIEAALYLESEWWFPVSTGAASRPSKWQLWRIDRNGRPSLFAERPMLMSFLTAGAPSRFIEAMASRDPRSILLANGTFLFGYVNDSLWAVDPQTGELRLAFHPIRPGMRVSDIGDGQVLFWIQNGRKSYVVDVMSSRGRK